MKALLDHLLASDVPGMATVRRLLEDGKASMWIENDSVLDQKG
jgi:hypothetical protein